MPRSVNGRPVETSEWPVDAGSMAAARLFLHSARGRVAVACDSDVDGLAGARIFEEALNALGCPSSVLPARRGEHVHRPGMKARIAATHPSHLIVVDMGSRPQPIIPGIRTLIVDHHHGRNGYPPNALVVNGFDRPPVAPSSVLAYLVCRTVPGIQRTAWLAALGAVADLGTASPFRDLLEVRGGGARWGRAVALLNAARRAPEPDPLVALDALRNATSIGDITSGRVPQADTLERYREQVRAEIDRCSRVAPKVVEEVALIRFSSGAQVHPVIATRWSRRLQPRIVLAANDGYLPGRTNFAVRCAADVNLVEWLRSLDFKPTPDAEYANGHARASGGSLGLDDFVSFLSALGFESATPRTPSLQSQ